MRRKRKGSEARLLKRLKVLMSKEVLSEKDKKELDKIFKKLNIDSSKRIKSTKLNNNKQDEVTVVEMSDAADNEIAKKIYAGDESLEFLTIDHLASAAGGYRKGRIDNTKNTEGYRKGRIANNKN
tara:strand:+ start:1175 stop:1549 length:375 start_codon:yes stop_codon:yes gene_type:complete